MNFGISAKFASSPDCHAAAYRGRGHILILLAGFAFFAYVQRSGIAVAGERMMPSLGISQVGFGWLLTTFLATYTVFQVPGGWLGERLGGHRSLTYISLVALAATVLTVLAPQFGGVLVFAVLLLGRALLGTAQAPIFPLVTGAVEGWFPRASWSKAQGLITGGMNLGSAVTPPLVAWLMTAFDWRVALALSTAPVAILTLWWMIYATDPPGAKPVLADTAMDGAPRTIASVIFDRDLLALSASYLMMNCVFYLLTFWCFLYFVQERHFSVIDSGWLTALPFLAAALGAASGGAATDRLRAMLGETWGFRLGPLIALPLGGCSLLVTMGATSVTAAVIGLCVTFAAIEFSEGAYWASVMRVCGCNTMIGGGVLNTAGNLGGIVGTPVIAVLSARHAWSTIFATGAVCALIAALFWLIVVPDRRAQSSA